MGSGLCCDVKYRTTSILPNNDCGGNDCNCGDLRVRGSSGTAPRAMTGTKFRTHALFAGPKKGVFDGAPLSEDVLFVPDRCKGSYGVIYPQDRVHDGSPASSQSARVQGNGG